MSVDWSGLVDQALALLGALAATAADDPVFAALVAAAVVLTFAFLRRRMRAAKALAAAAPGITDEIVVGDAERPEPRRKAKPEAPIDHRFAKLRDQASALDSGTPLRRHFGGEGRTTSRSKLRARR